MKLILSTLTLTLFGPLAYASDVCTVLFPANGSEVTARCTASLHFMVPQTVNSNVLIKKFEDNGYEFRTKDGAAYYVFVKK